MSDEPTIIDAVYDQMKAVAADLTDVLHDAGLLSEDMEVRFDVTPILRTVDGSKEDDDE
jgi:hypothetical protein